MEEQVNIPALGIICVYVRISKARALYGYAFRKIEVLSSDNADSCWRGSQKSIYTRGYIKLYRKPTQVVRSSRPR